MNRWRFSRTQILLVLILLLALALRLWLWSRPEHPLANDETEYLPVGLDLANGRGFVFYDTYRWLRAPLYPLFLGFFLFVSGDSTRLVTLVQVLLSTATVYLFFLLARRFFAGEQGEQAGLVSALLAALLLPFATFPSLFMSETLFTFLFTAFLVVVLGVPGARARQQWRCVLAAGALLGLCALTRAVAFAFIPLAAVWLVFALRGSASHPFRLGLFFVLIALGTIAPWTVRNAIAYDRFIPLDTGASFSVWAFYEPREELEEIHRQLEAIPNPADRQAYALQKGWGRLREDPAIFLRKLQRAFPLLFRIKPIEDRFLKIPYREPSLAYFSLALLLDDGLYVLITGVSLAFLIFAPTNRGKTLALLWLSYNIAVMIVLHPEARYRQLLFPVMIPPAGWGVVRGKRFLARAQRGLVAKVALFSLILLGWGYCLVSYSPWDWVWVNLQRGYHQTVGQVAWTLGQSEAALRAFERAVDVDERNPETYYDLGRALERLGRLQEAARVYRWGWDVQATYLPCSAALGNVQRRLGLLDQARDSFLGRFVAEGDVVMWSWTHLDVVPAERLDLGAGLDYGYVAGVHAPEVVGGVSYRWTGRQARFRLWPATTGEVQLRFRLAAPRLGESPPVSVDVRLDGRHLTRWTVEPLWGLYETPVFSTEAGTELDIVLQSEVFVPHESVPSSPDVRELGVQVDWVEIVTGITAESP